MISKKKISQEENELLAEGVYLRMDTWKQEENRLLSLVLKAVLIYLVSMGGIGCYLSSLEISCAYPIIHLAVFLAALFCVVLYYNRLWENLGYVCLLFLMLAVGILLRNYISSGFFVVANQLGERAAVFFDSSAVRSYAEQVSDRYLAVTVSMCYIGWVCCILMNVLISRRMQYLTAAVLIIGMLVIPLYIEQEPAPFYVAMLLSGLISVYAIRGSGHYALSRKNDRYCYQEKKKTISYVYANKTMASLVLGVFLVCLCVTMVLSVLYPSDRFDDNREISSLKESTMDTMGNFMLLGVMGLFNYYPNTGGLTSGRLGGVNAIRYDYETDLTVEYTPYSEERLYLKTFTGAHYRPYVNFWDRSTDDSGQTILETADSTVEDRRYDFEKGLPKTARGRMTVTNVEAASGFYLPYYSDDMDKVVRMGETADYEFYPPLSESRYLVMESPEDWLEVPAANENAIQIFCQEAGLQPGDTKEEVIRILTAYFRQNIPYTIRPGATPYRQDFVNYFLMRNKKGYCAHYASAATLILRYLGIPARYVEGYAIDPVDLTEDAEILSDRQYGDYYEGYNPLGETTVLSVNVTDASAHAWVEVLDEDQGWQVVEFTPPSDRNGGDAMSLWERLAGLLSQDSGEQVTEQGGGDTLTSVGGRIGRQSAVVIAVFLFLALAVGGVYFICRRFRGVYSYLRAGRQERLLMDYRSYIGRQAKREPALSAFVNFRQQVHWLAENGRWELSAEEVEQCVGVLERAAFSEHALKEDEIQRIYHLIRR